MTKYSREEIERMARKLAISGDKDDGFVPPFASLRGQKKFEDYPGDSRVVPNEHKSIRNDKFEIHWDRGEVIFGRDSGSSYDRIRIYYDMVMVLDPSMWDHGIWEDKLLEWFQLIFPEG